MFSPSCIARSDLESVLASIHETIFADNKEAGEGSNKRTFEAFLNSAVFSTDAEGVSEKSMSLPDFRNWCIIMPSLRKFLGSLLMPPDSGLCYYSADFSKKKKGGAFLVAASCSYLMHLDKHAVDGQIWSCFNVYI